MKKIIGYIVMIVFAIVLATQMWNIHAVVNMFFMVSMAILSGLAWEEWQDIKARRANARRNIELSRR